MYRNTYLQMYKNAHNNDSSIILTFAHFTQIYNTLGCVLQDIEFQIGKLLIQPPPNIISKDQSIQIPIKYSDKSVQKQTIRAEQCNNQNTAKNGTVKMAFEKQMPQPKNNNTDTTKKINNISEQTESNWMVNKLIEGRPSNPRETTAKNSVNAMSGVQQARRGAQNNLVSTSFQDLFNRKPTNKMDLQQCNNIVQPMAETANANNGMPNGGGHSTFDDFFDRFFQKK